MLHIVNLNQNAKQNLHDCLLALAAGDQVILITSLDLLGLDELVDSIKKIASALGDKPKLLLPELASSGGNTSKHSQHPFAGIAEDIGMDEFVKLSEVQKSVSWF